MNKETRERIDIHLKERLALAILVLVNDAIELGEKINAEEVKKLANDWGVTCRINGNLSTNDARLDRINLDVEGDLAKKVIIG